MYIGGMIKPIASFLMAACLSTFCPSTLPAQVEQVDGAAETTLAVLEGPLSREALNDIRIALAEVDVKFNYGHFQFHPATGDLFGVEIFLVIEGVEYRDYFEFPTQDCSLRILKESGFRMEGC